MPWPLDGLLKRSGLRFELSPHQSLDSRSIHGCAGLDFATSQQISFYKGEEANAPKLANSKAGAIFVPLKHLQYDDHNLGSDSSVRIGVENPKAALLCIMQIMEADLQGAWDHHCKNDIHPSAQIHPTAIVEGRVGEGAVVGPYCYIAPRAIVGAHSILYSHVVLYPRVELGEHCRLQSHVVIGAEGFGFEKGQQFLHLGGVRIGNKVYLGSHTVVAAGMFHPTRIDDDCIIDNFVQISHNCVVERGVAMSAHSAIAGSVWVKAGAILAGAAKVADHLTIGVKSIVAANAGVTKSVPDGVTVAGYPAEEIGAWRKHMVRSRRYFNDDHA